MQWVLRGRHLSSYLNWYSLIILISYINFFFIEIIKKEEREDDKNRRGKSYSVLKKKKRNLDTFSDKIYLLFLIINK